MSVIEQKLTELGLALPPTRKWTNPNRRGCIRTGNIIFVSGHGAHHPGMNFRQIGKLGHDMSVEEGVVTARTAALTILATLKEEIGSLDRIKRVIRIFGMVNCTADFQRMSEVIDGASDLFLHLFGSESGCHARSAVGQVSLPRGQAVEINGEFETT